MPRWYEITDPTGTLTIPFNQTSDGLLVPDDNGVYWSIEELDGWDGPDVRQVLIDTYGQDGVALGVNEFSSRTLTLSNGFVFAPSEAARFVAETQYATLLAATKAQGPCLIVVHEDIDRYMYGFLASKPEYKEVPPGAVASYFPTEQWPFQINGSLLCPDPIKNSANGASPQSLVRNGSIAIPTLGNYPVWPVITFDFPANNDTIVNDQNGLGIVVTSQYRGSNADMPDALHIDMLNRTVTDQVGQPAWDCISAIEWFQIQPNGVTTVSYHLGSSSPLGTQEAVVAWNDAWL
jgi:hypothetical protein